MSYRNPKWLSADKSVVSAEIDGGCVAASAGSPVFAEIVAAGVPAPFVAPPVAEAIVEDSLKSEVEGLRAVVAKQQAFIDALAGEAAKKLNT